MSQLHATHGETVHQTHRLLFEELRALRAALRSPSSDLSEKLEETGALLREHFALKEEGGYLASVLEVQPQMGRAVRRLMDERGQILRHLDEVLDEARRGDMAREEFRQKVRDWVANVRRHEARENCLVQDTYGLDLSAED